MLVMRLHVCIKQFSLRRSESLKKMFLEDVHQETVNNAPVGDLHNQCNPLILTLLLNLTLAGISR